MKNNIKKTILTLIAIITLMSTVAVLPTYAALPDTGGTVEPRWDYTSVINTSLGFIEEENYGAAECSVVAQYHDVTITIDIVVHRKIGFLWVHVTEGHFEIDDSMALVTCPFSPIKGKTYRATYTITVTRNGSNEVITKTQTSTYK